MGMFEGYTKAVYVNSIYAGTTYNTKKVHNDFMQDIKTYKQVYVTKNSSCVFITLKNETTMIYYTLPLEYIKYTEGLTTT